MTTTIPPGFTERFAIRMPNGLIAGVGLYADRTAAEHALLIMRTTASQQLGVGDWSGHVVRQLCTPFIGDRDNADHLIGELTNWLNTQTGGAL